VESILAITRDFEVCGTCRELRGPFTRHVQQCRCERHAREREKWPGFDFDTVAELCYVCGCEVLRSGSRYSVWLCSVCKARALEHDRGLVPVGRHLFMNGIAPRITGETTDAQIDALANRLILMGDRINRLANWAHIVVGSNLTVIGRDDGASVALPEYLDAVRSIDRGAAFDAMLASEAVENRSDT
jgi:hypothetical protein